MPFRWKDWALPLIGVTCLCGIFVCVLVSPPKDEDGNDMSRWSAALLVSFVLVVAAVCIASMAFGRFSG